MSKLFRGLVRGLSLAGVIAFAAVALPFSVKAAYDPYTAYSASEVSRSHAESITMKPGQVLEYTVSFKNVGTDTWVNYGNRYVSVYTHNPETLKYLNSEFRHESWLDWNHPMALRENVVSPGNVGTVTVKLKAPLVVGEYNETFRLAVEDYIWMPGGRFSINIKVQGEIVSEIPPPSAVKPTPAPSPTPAATPTSVSNASVVSAQGYKAIMLIASARDLAMQGGQSTSLRLGFKNIGEQTWQRSGTSPVRLRLASGSADSIKNPSWNGDIAAELPNDQILPGQLVFFDVKLVAPQVSGIFNPKFEIVAGSSPVEGGSFALPINITSNSSAASSAGSVGEHLYISDFAGVGQRGPNVRLGLYNTTSPVVIASSGAYNLMSGDGGLLKQLSGVTTVQFDWASKSYYISNGGFSQVSQVFPKFIPVDYASNIFEISSYENRAAWDSQYNFNQFRGTLEVRYAPITDRLWVIEELPMEDYLHGLAETSNSSHFEYQKALVTAARTYAMYVLYIGGKHMKEFHHLVTNGNDQVYKGYLSELLRPNVVRAVDETRGLVVSYNNELVVTPYFSRSDGRTRAWSEVWYGSKPWLVSKPAPYDAREGFALWGHGVGMSAMDAYYRAGDGWTWDSILKYYYTGIDIRRIY